MSEAVLDTLDRDDRVLCAAGAGIWVMVLFAEPTEPAMRRAHGALQATGKRHPSGFPTLTWVLREAGMRMSDEARKAATEVTRLHERSIVAQATLIEGVVDHRARDRARRGARDLRLKARRKIGRRPLRSAGMAGEFIAS